MDISSADYYYDDQQTFEKDRPRKKRKPRYKIENQKKTTKKKKKPRYNRPKGIFVEKKSLKEIYMDRIEAPDFE